MLLVRDLSLEETHFSAVYSRHEKRLNGFEVRRKMLFSPHIGLNKH